MKNKIILITGAAGFIGFHLSEHLLNKRYRIVGIDNMNDYYDVSLKEARLNILKKHDEFIFIKGDIADKALMKKIFEEYHSEIVINLAAQAGVRYSIENPEAYLNSNLIGFFNILEECKRHKVAHLIFASSSSVYGQRSKVPFEEDENTDRPVSFYAATKKSNEVMAYSYSCLYGIPTTGLRFFTVYGPLGRPDMAYFKFANKIRDGKKIEVYNNGDMIRDFTYIDDIVNSIEKLLEFPPKADDQGVKYKLYNIGRGKPEKLLDLIKCIESSYGKHAELEMLPMQPGDVCITYSDTSELYNDIGYHPEVELKDGIDRFIKWYQEYYSIKN